MRAVETVYAAESAATAVFPPKGDIATQNRSLHASLLGMREAFWELEQTQPAGIGAGPGAMAAPTVHCHDLAVNLIGMLASEKGVGEAARTTLRSLQAAGVTVNLLNFTDTGSENSDQTCAPGSNNPVHPVNLLHVGPDVFDLFLDQGGAQQLAGHYNIACWAWELGDFPPDWKRHLSRVDEIWTPSRFCQEALSRVSPVPVVRLPHSVAPWPVLSGHDRSHFHLPVDCFVFLFVFDFSSSIVRKNPLGLVKAFRSAFAPDEPVMLMLKSTHADHDPVQRTILQEAVAGSNIRWLDGVVPRDELNALLNHCDCYISLHRSEGFGLTMAEAMCLGKPVIGTDFSGNTDFISTANSLPVRCQLLPIEQSEGQYARGSVWAEPDLEEAARLMRQVWQQPARAQELGQRARRCVVESLSPQVVGEMMRHRLEEIQANTVEHV